MASHSSFESLCDSTSQWAFVSCGANEPSLTNSLNSDPVEDFRLNAWEKRSLNCHYVFINQLPHNQWTFKFQVSDPNLGLSPESSGGQCEPCSVTHILPESQMITSPVFDLFICFRLSYFDSRLFGLGISRAWEGSVIIFFLDYATYVKKSLSNDVKKKISFARGREERHLILTFQVRNGREHETQWTSETIVNY